LDRLLRRDFYRIKAMTVPASGLEIIGWGRGLARLFWASPRREFFRLHIRADFSSGYET
jgi:hypothetical protein